MNRVKGGSEGTESLQTLDNIVRIGKRDVTTGSDKVNRSKDVEILGRR